MSKPTLPVLGSEGWAQDPEILMSRLFSHSFVSDFSQSNVYAGTVMSLQYLISQHGHDSLALSEAVRKAYKIYYSRYFDNVSVDFKRSDFFDESNNADMDFNLSISGYINNVQYDLNRRLRVDSSASTVRFIEALQE